MATKKLNAVENEIDHLGWGFVLDAQYDITTIDVDKDRVQVRDAGHYAPKDNVFAYSEAMKEGAKFPPIVLSADGKLVDGNTRVVAARRAKLTYFPAYIIDRPFVGASKRDDAYFHMLAATLNQQGAQRLTAAEARAAVKNYFLTANSSVANIARSLGVGSSVVTAVKREAAAENRLEKLGLFQAPEDKKRITGAVLRALGKEPVLALNDAPYAELVRLTDDAGLNATEIGSLAREAREAGSDAGSLAIIERVRGESEGRIAQKRITGVGSPSNSTMLRMRLGWIVKFANTPEDLVERNRDYYDNHIEDIEKSIVILENVLKAQQR